MFNATVAVLFTQPFIYFSSQGLTLHFVVLSFDRYSRDDVIGELMVDLENLDLSGSDSQPIAIAREITPRSFKVKSLGNGKKSLFLEAETLRIVNSLLSRSCYFYNPRVFQLTFVGVNLFFHSFQLQGSNIYLFPSLALSNIINL